MGGISMRIGLLLLLIGGAALAGANAGGGPAVYVIGNLDGISPGSEGILVLDEGRAIFRSGKTGVAIRYQDIRNAELGTKLNPPADVPLYKIWQLYKRFAGRTVHQMLMLEFVNKDGNGQSMTLELEEAAAVDTLAALEFRTGKRHRATNGEGWWGDSLWKTPENHNTVSAEPLGNAPNP
jgi:hypothetical protein